MELSDPLTMWRNLTYGEKTQLISVAGGYGLLVDDYRDFERAGLLTQNEDGVVIFTEFGRKVLEARNHDRP